MPATSDLDALSFEFFREFARCEYCLKVIGLCEPERRDPTADWGAFAGQIPGVLESQADPQLVEAVGYILAEPPKKQAFVNGVLAWRDSTPDHANQSELVLRLVCRVRNNLFHGGKFNGHWFAPQRSERLLQSGLTILRAAVAGHERVREAYDLKADY